jgi:hypothetical protein
MFLVADEKTKGSGLIGSYETILKQLHLQTLHYLK